MHFVFKLSIYLLWFLQTQTLQVCGINYKSNSFCYYFSNCVQLSCSRDKTSGLEEYLEKDFINESENNNIDDIMSSGSGLTGLYRPRSALARALYEKQRNDRELRQIDKTEWYSVDKKRLTPEMQQKFVQLSPDEETKRFIAASVDKSSWIWTQIWYLLARAVLRYFWSITDINGWLGRGSMFVLSEEQARAMGAGGAGGGSMVDVGAGDGEVSRRWGGLFPRRYATEISASMRRLLSDKGYTVLSTEDWWRSERFDCVCMLNLLDRCARPRSMLQQARAALRPGGSLLLALVLPYKPYVEVTADHKPEERLPVEGAGLEEQAGSLVRWMHDEGWTLQRWARVPYLCEGDATQAYYWLNDSVYVFTPTPLTSPADS